MRFKNYLFTILCAVIVVSFTIMADADTVSWTSEQYTATARAFASDVQYGPPLPVSASYVWSSFASNHSESLITNTYMDVSAQSSSLEYYLWGTAEFLGSYISSANTPLFQFTYDGYFSSVNPGYASEHYAWLTVTDLTSSTVLYNDASLSLDSSTHTIEISTIAGHEIEVYFGAKALAAREFSTQTENVRLNYSTAVAPEPISSILFVTGGTLLAGRRYMKRKKKA